MIPSSNILNLERVVPETEIKNLLNLKDEYAIYLRRQRLANNKVIALDHSFVPERLYGEINESEIINNSLYTLLEKRGLRPDRAVESFSATSLLGDEAELLGMKEGEAVLKVTRKAFHGDDIVEYNYRYYNNNRYTYSIELK